MEKTDFIRRLEDLAERCERTSSPSVTFFLTPAEQYELKQWNHKAAQKIILFGGGTENERKIALFLPFYLEESDVPPDEYIDAVRIRSYFGAPEHRDYMGAILGLGIKREWIGDIQVSGDTCHVFCLKSVTKVLLNDLSKVGKYSVKTAPCRLNEIPVMEKEFRSVNFTVKSLRLDAVTGDMFRVSRTQAADAIRAELVSLNYSICSKTDAEVREGDVISVRGKGKGRITEIGGKSKKDRLFVTAELYR